MKSIENLVKQAQAIMPEPYGSPKYDLWKHDTRKYIEKTFGSELTLMFNRIVRSGGAIYAGQDMQATRNKRIVRAIEFLEELKTRNAESDLSTSSASNTMQAAKEAVQTRFDRTHITVTGNATFGDNSPLNHIQISEFITALIEEVEKLPDSSEKKGLLQNLKAVLENPTLASVAGGFVGGVMQGLVK